jgi:hypothetical protein
MLNSKIALIMLWLVAFSGDAAAQRGGGGGSSATCRPADEFVTYTLSALKNLVTATDSAAIKSRQLRGLPAVAPSQVSYITDNSVCAKAEKAYTSAITPAGATPSLQVYVFRVGNVYQIWDPVQRAGEFTIAMTLNNSYKLVSKYTL